MKFTVMLAAFLSTAAAWKCTCNDYEASKSLCANMGHLFSERSCDNVGCCLSTSEVDAFVDVCKRAGGGFHECMDCRDCY